MHVIFSSKCLKIYCSILKILSNIFTVNKYVINLMNLTLIEIIE